MSVRLRAAGVRHGSAESFDSAAGKALTRVNDHDPVVDLLADRNAADTGWLISRRKPARTNGRGVNRSCRSARKRRTAGHRATRRNGDVRGTPALGRLMQEWHTGARDPVCRVAAQFVEGHPTDDGLALAAVESLKANRRYVPAPRRAELNATIRKLESTIRSSR